MKKLFQMVPVCALLLSVGLWGAEMAQAAPMQTEQAKGTKASSKSSKPKKHTWEKKSAPAEKKPAVSTPTTQK